MGVAVLCRMCHDVGAGGCLWSWGVAVSRKLVVIGW